MLQGKTGPRVALKYEGKSLTPRPPLVPRAAHDNRPHPVPDPHPLLALGTRSRIIPGAGSHSPSGSSKDLHEDNLDRQSESIPGRRRTHRHVVELQQGWLRPQSAAACCRTALALCHRHVPTPPLAQPGREC